MNKKMDIGFHNWAHDGVEYWGTQSYTASYIRRYGISCYCNHSTGETECTDANGRNVSREELKKLLEQD